MEEKIFYKYIFIKKKEQKRNKLVDLAAIYYTYIYIEGERER